MRRCAIDRAPVVVQVGVNVRVTARDEISPHEARELAAALVRCADLADARMTERGGKRKGGR